MGRADDELYEALRESDVAGVRAALRSGANVNCRFSDGVSPLHIAAGNGSQSGCLLLLERGADVNVTDRFGRTPLHWAAIDGHAHICMMLLEEGVDVDAINSSEGFTALHTAAQQGHAYACKVLLEHGSDVEATSSNGYRPLHVAACNDRSSVCTVLLEKGGADVRARNRNGRTALDMASDDATRAVLRAGLSAAAEAEAAAQRAEDARAAEAARRKAAKAAEAAQLAAQARATAEAEAASRKAAEDTAAAQRAAQARATAEAQAAQRKAADEVAAAATAAAAVPADVAALLSRLSLSSYGAVLCNKLGMTCAADAALLTEADLEHVGMRPLERRKLLAATDASGGRVEPVASPAVVRPLGAPGARPRVRALCVGINAYGSPVPGKLTNAVADATAVHKALSALPGAGSTLLTDCSKAIFEAALVDFRDGTGVCKGRGMGITAAWEPVEPTLAVVFFAGHGLQLSGRNYLVPADFRVPNKNDKLDVMLRDTAKACVSLSEIEEVLEDAGVTAGAVLLDCCRNVPDFLAMLGATRSASGGTRTLPSGMGVAVPRLHDLMVTFATAPGTEALDCSTRVPVHSPFTAALLKAFAAPRRLLELNPFLTDEVHADTAGRQRPHVSGSYGVEAGNMLLG